MRRQEQVDSWKKAIPEEPVRPYLRALEARSTDASDPLPSLRRLGLGESNDKAKESLDALSGIASAIAAVSAVQSRTPHTALRPPPSPAASCSTTPPPKPLCSTAPNHGLSPDLVAADRRG